jgi:hypothetical protein
MIDPYKTRIKDFFNDLGQRSQDQFLLDCTERKSVFNNILNILNIPHPPTELEKYFLHPNILSELIFELINASHLSRDERTELNPLFTKVHKNLKKKISNYSYRLRVLSPGGLYPNIQIKREFSNYFIQNQQPVLITKNRNYKNSFPYFSIINWLTKTELKFATSIMCAPQRGVFHLCFTSFNTVNIDCECFEGIPENLKNQFFREYFEIKKRFTPIGVSSWHRHTQPDITTYEFGNYEDNIQPFNEIYDKFHITNDLLLRTANYFVKAIMLWENQIYAEEAIANTFFCLEGCLHLLQKKYGDFNPKLNMKLLETVFKRDITMGENIFEFIKEGYELRIALVHPEPEWGAEWSPSVTSEDFYEYFGLCRELLSFILIDRSLNDY